MNAITKDYPELSEWFQVNQCQIFFSMAAFNYTGNQGSRSFIDIGTTEITLFFFLKSISSVRNLFLFYVRKYLCSY